MRILLTAGAAVLVLAGFYFYSHNAAVAPVENPAATETENSGGAVFPVAPGAPNNEGTGKTTSSVPPSKNTGGTHIQTSLLKVTMPNGGERWEQGGQYTIQWSHTNTIKSLAYSRTLVELISREGTALEFKKTLFNFPVYIVAAPDSVQWAVTDTPDRADYKIRVSYQTSNYANFGGLVFNGLSYEDMSDAPFSIMTKNPDAPFLMLINPNGGQKFRIGEKYQIMWKKNKLGTAVIVELYKGNEFITRISSALGTYASLIEWIVRRPPAEAATAGELAPGSDYRIRLLTFPAVGDAQFEDFSDAAFSIQ